ncbi:hypothetical protein KGF56_003298 [Candida oxycetoniae]|uniref:PDZ GRASP-type domain-containing protein n=1 Tax=Candida oxycetoniae TaxID=497107 RepID=A0AAI9SVJ1_9ASCO|nr:uncharacterized protein KGF56_003298 [Candida oxycetoniae]KAI3403868.1 hypothetical protein KGF56_003298 [Candida oxycetoniae]
MFSFAKKLVDRLEGQASQDDSFNDAYFKNATHINNRGYGLRVLNVVAHSKAHEYGFESWFDYIIKINNHELPLLHAFSTYSYTINEDGTINYGNSTTAEQAAAVNFDLLNKELTTLAQHKQDLILDVWNAKGGVIRQISIPLEEEEEEGEEGEKTEEKGEKTEEKGEKTEEKGEKTEEKGEKTEEKGEKTEEKGEKTEEKGGAKSLKKLGLTVESQHLNTATFVWRILNTHVGSPAFRSQLVPHSDFIIGCDSAFPNDPNSKGLLSKGGESLLSNTILSYYNHHYAQSGEDNIPITLYVYNHDYDILRPVTVNLSRQWGTGHNRGILGCDVGYGLIHRIPEVVGKFEKNSIIDDVLFQSENTAVDLDTSTNVVLSAPPPLGATKPSTRSARKKKHIVADSQELNDYMNEELDKSKKLEDSVKHETGDLVPPPPPPTTATTKAG